MTSDPDEKFSRHRLDSWQILLIAAAVVLATIGFAYITWWDAGAPVDDFPAWLEAWATVAAVGAAIIAGFYAARAFKLEFEREDRWEKSNRATQASRVAAWPVELSFEHGVTEGSDGYEVPIAVDGAVVRVRNASDMPIARTRLVVTVMVVFADGRGEERTIGEADHGLIDPDSTVDVFIPADDPSMLQPLMDADTYREIRVFLQFTDVVGRSWSRRTHEGELHDGGTRAERTLYVPRRRWHRVYDPVRIAGQRWLWQQ